MTDYWQAVRVNATLYQLAQEKAMVKLISVQQLKISLMNDKCKIRKLKMLRALGNFSGEQAAKLKEKKEYRREKKKELQEMLTDERKLNDDVKDYKGKAERAAKSLSGRIEKVMGIEDLLALKFLKENVPSNSVKFTLSTSVRQCIVYLLHHMAYEFKLPEPKSTIVYKFNEGVFKKLDEASARAAGFTYPLYER